MAMEGGVTLAVCVAPVMVISKLEQEEVAAGQTCRRHLLPAGVMNVLLGTGAFTKRPAPFKTPEITCAVLNGAPFQRYGPGLPGAGIKENEYVPSFHV
jgi:hypothetical protein